MQDELDYSQINLPKTKDGAMMRGYSYFYPEVNCNNGHESVRRVINSFCLDCEILLRNQNGEEENN